MAKLVPPHGSDSVLSLMVPEGDRAGEVERAKGLPQIPLTSREVSDVFMLGMGAYTPLSGFMGKDDWHGVCVDMKMANGLFWPIPVTLSTSDEIAGSLSERSFCSPGSFDRSYSSVSSVS